MSQKAHLVAALAVFFLSTSILIVGQNSSTFRHVNQSSYPDEIIRVDTNLVTLSATVLDRDGRYKTDLRKEDFQIFEDGVEQEIGFFEPAEQPFTILFLIDVSSSMSRYDENLSVAVNALASRLRPDDRLMAVSFFQWTDVLIKATKIAELNHGIKLKVREDRDCPTYLYDAVDDSLKRMKKIPGRKAIVLFSDGEGTGFGVTAKDTLRRAEEQDATVYTFKFGTYPPSSRRYLSQKMWDKRIEEIVGYMRDLAQKTGGRSYQIEEITDLERTFGSVVEEMGRQYSLGYYPKNQLAGNQTRQIKVRVRLPNLAIRARDSYTFKAAKE